MRRGHVPLDLNSPGLCLKTKHCCQSDMKTLSLQHVKVPSGQHPVLLRGPVPKGNQAGGTVPETATCQTDRGLHCSYCQFSPHFKSFNLDLNPSSVISP